MHAPTSPRANDGPPEGNRLARASSAYLRSAAHQPVDWHPWSPEAFARAQQEDKPILLDIGAAWCHWCHVLDHESYEDPEVAKIINERYIAIKVDRDERPDIDTRYQQAVSAISGQGGWPLTGFLTPTGKVFYGGTYFPPVDAHGRPSFKRVLLSVAQYYQESKGDALKVADELHQQLGALGGARGPTQLDPALLDRAVESLGQAFDMANGGFGSAPKFPHPSAIELLLRRYARRREDWVLTIVTRTLEKMARGGVHDQIGGGFHRYSTDARWIVPHFEKMLYDNAGLLSSYVHGFQATGNLYLRAVAEDTIEFMATVLTNVAHGGFYGSQDADLGPEDDGSYFTWTPDEARAVLSPEEFAAIAAHYHLLGPGEMHDAARRHVLHVDRDADVIAAGSGQEAEEVRRLIERGRLAMAQARVQRPTPFVDSACYTNWNGMAIAAFLEAYKVLGQERCRLLALTTLDRFLAEAYTPERGFVHVLGADPTSAPPLLDDQVQMASALLVAYEVTGHSPYLLTARHVMDLVLRDSWDTRGGFFDVPKGTTGPALETPHYPVQDAPTPAPNAVAALMLLQLTRLFDAPNYRDHAEQLLGAFAPALADHALYSSTLLIALDDFLHEPAHVTIVGRRDDPRTAALHRAALTAYRPDKLISLYPDGEVAIPLPLAVRAMVAAATEPRAYVCAGTACAPPAGDPRTLSETLQTFGR